MSRHFDFEAVTKEFPLEGRLVEAKPYGCGHINDTFAIVFEKNNNFKRYILQRINKYVFKRPEKLMNNIELVTKHLKKKIIEAGGNPERETLNIIYNNDGSSFYKSPEGDYWRVYIFIENASTYQKVENGSHMYNAGKAFGMFQMHLNDFPAQDLYEIIPGFHDTRKRYQAFLKSVDEDIKNRAALVKDEIDFIVKRKADTSILVGLLEDKKLPLKVTHNDTKFNNVMIDDKTGKGICVIDLDTVMPGLSLYDFGDTIRTGASTAKEDETKLETVDINLEFFTSFTKGFIESAGTSLSKMEIEYLPFAAKLMTLENGIRFLTDYLSGDVYFKIHREDHNLIRARNQFKLVTEIESKIEKMSDIVCSLF